MLREIPLMEEATSAMVMTREALSMDRLCDRFPFAFLHPFASNSQPHLNFYAYLED